MPSPPPAGAATAREALARQVRRWRERERPQRLRDQELVDIRWASRVLVGAPERRLAEGAAACELLRRYEPQTIWDYWTWNKVRLLATHRARKLGLTTPLWDALEAPLAQQTRERGLEQEMTAFKVTRILARDGIKAVTIKGPVMAKQLYGRVDLRDPSADVDILVAASNLHRAKELLEQHGWRPDGDPLLHGDFPVLHFAMWGPEGEHNVELHWRVQWYDGAEHSSALLARAVEQPGGVWALSEVDTLELLLLCWARDGFHRLRLPADVAAWWDARDGRPDEPNAAHPPGFEPASSQLAPVWDRAASGRAASIAATANAQLIGTPMADADAVAPAGWRSRAALRVADRDHHRTRPANRSSQRALVDALVCPRSEIWTRTTTTSLLHPALSRHAHPWAPSALVPLLRLASGATTAAHAPRALR